MAEIIPFLLIVSLLLGVYFQWKTIDILKSAYTETWISLGRPHFLNNSIPTTIKLHKYIWKKQYEILNHSTVSKYCQILRGYQLFYLVLLPFIFTIYIIALGK